MVYFYAILWPWLFLIELFSDSPNLLAPPIYPSLAPPPLAPFALHTPYSTHAKSLATLSDLS
ncbi:hypothetical protein BKH46_05885 [Helicobacter sp. 12S02634-8]|nr:hypothetical protein BKH46_05885 [Helicobacter sp. 12S02634-8]